MSKMQNSNPKTLNKGFTLIEMMVAVSLFAVVMTMSLSAILAIIDGNKKAQAINAVANNLNFAIESMVREIKTGYAYHCTTEGTAVAGMFDPFPASETTCIPQDGSNKIMLISTIAQGRERVVQYEYVNDGTNNTGWIEKKVYIEGDDGTISPTTSRVTSPEVNIQGATFYINNPEKSEGQPNVFVVIKGTARVNPTQTSDFSIQTLISQRNLNL